MPTLALLLLEAALGLATASLAAAELRASTRPLAGTHGFRALALHALCVVLPAGLFLLLRYADWMASYAVDGAAVPSAVSLLLALLIAAAPLGGFALGARWVRDHDARRPLLAAAATAAVVLALCVALRGRVGYVGTHVQFRGGFGLTRLTASSLFAALAAIAVAQGAGYALLARHLGGAARE